MWHYFDWLQAMFALLLKYKDTLGVPRFGRRLVQLSKNLKFFRGLLGNQDQADLVLVATPTDMALERESGSGRRLSGGGIAAPTPVPQPADTERGMSTLCYPGGMRQDPRRSLHNHRSHAPQTRIYRGDPPRGPETLATLGAAGFRSDT